VSRLLAFRTFFRHPRSAALSLACIVGLALTWTLPHRPPIFHTNGVMDVTGTRDAAILLGTKYLYNPFTYGRLQQEQGLGAAISRVSLRAPWYVFATRWMARMSNERAVILWKLCIVCLAVMVVALWPQHWLAAVALAWSFPLAATIEQGQDAAVLLVCLIASGLLATRRRDLVAGVVLSLCSIKPNLMVLVPIALLASRRWRIVAGGLAGLAGQIILSDVVQGSEWPVQLWHVLRTPILYSTFPHSPSLVHVVQNFTYGAQFVLSLVLAAAFAPVVAAIARRDAALGIYAAVAVGVVTSMHAFLQDAVLVLPFAFAVIAGALDWRRWAAFWIASPLSTVALAWQVPSVESLALSLPVVAVVVACGRGGFDQRLAFAGAGSTGDAGTS
jgi:hypothetical protein